MDDDLIVVDDVENGSGPSTSVHEPTDVPSSHASSRPKTVTERNIGPSRLRNSITPSPLGVDNSDRTTRSSNTKSKPQPKLKLKLSDKAASQAPGTSFLGQYDRELDSDDEDLAFEEQFILRMPPGEDCDKLRKVVASREVGDDVWFKFKGAYPALIYGTFLPCYSAYNSRLTSCCIPYWKQPLLCQTCRPTVHS